MQLSQRSIKNLEGVHPDLVAVVHKAAELLDGDLGFVVTEGLRTKEKQAQYVKAGASWTMDSRHLTGHAVDLAATINGDVRWDWPLYLQLASVVGEASQKLGIPLRWGGTWSPLEARPYKASELHKSKPDGPHFELPIQMYPAEEAHGATNAA